MGGNKYKQTLADFVYWSAKTVKLSEGCCCDLRLSLNYNTMLYQTFICLFLNEAKRLCLNHCFRLLDFYECETFNLFVTQISRNLRYFFSINVFIKHCIIVYPEPNCANTEWIYHSLIDKSLRQTVLFCDSAGINNFHIHTNDMKTSF